MSERNFKDDVALDKFALDFESERQASIYLHWSQESAKARRKRDRAKLEFEMRSAELATTFRANAEKKPTNDQVSEYLASHKELRGLREDWIDAEYDYNELEGACTALEMKKSSIENLVKLHLNQYFSRPAGYSREQGISESFREGLGKDRARS